MTVEFYTSAVESAIDAIATQINITNCNFPIGDTIAWDNKFKAVDENLWVFAKPPVEGYTCEDCSFTQAEMTAGVDLTDITVLPRDPAWYGSEE